MKQPLFWTEQSCQSLLLIRVRKIFSHEELYHLCHQTLKQRVTLDHLWAINKLFLFFLFAWFNLLHALGLYFI